MSFSPHPSLPYSAFRQACRAFKPSKLVPAIARMSARLGEPPYAQGVGIDTPPWGLAAAARESLLHGNEHRSKSVDDRALRALMHMYQIAHDLTDEDVASSDFLVSLMTQIAYEQFPYQESMFEELARAHAWMVEGLDDVPTKVITEESLATMLDGVPLREAIGATFVLHVGALQNGGTYDAGWLDQPNFANVLEIYPRDNIEKMANRLIATQADFKADYHRHALGTAGAARYDYNPLVAKPFVDLGHGLPVAPAPRLIMRTVAPGGLYYTGMAAYGNAFAEDLGTLFEHYIGRQLSLIDGARVHPEVRFGKGNGSKSVDWFVVFPGLVVLVEVKSRRLGPAARAGGPTLQRALTDTLVGARRQLSTTIENLAARHEAFSHIPTDRPILALIVTAEPFYTGATFLRGQGVAVIPGGALPDVPVTTASAREVEWLVTHGAAVEGLLLGRIANRGDGVVSLRSIGKKLGVENPVLSAAWESYPWPQSERQAE